MIEETVSDLVIQTKFLLVRCGTRTHDLSRVNPFKPLSVTWGYQGKPSSDGK